MLDTYLTSRYNTKRTPKNHADFEKCLHFNFIILECRQYLSGGIVVGVGVGGRGIGYGGAGAAAAAAVDACASNGAGAGTANSHVADIQRNDSVTLLRKWSVRLKQGSVAVIVFTH